MTFKDPFDLLRHMQVIKYGSWDEKAQRAISWEEMINWDDSKYDDDLYLLHNLRVLFPEEVWEKRIGNCFDTSLMEYVALMNYKPKVFYIDINYDKVYTEDFKQHLGVTFQMDKSFWWFEYSWYRFRGIHGPYETEDAMFDTIKFLYEKSFTGKVYFNRECDINKLLKVGIIKPHHITKMGHNEL